MKDDLRAPGTVEVSCTAPGCRNAFWVEALDPRLPGGPFLCFEHDPDYLTPALPFPKHLAAELASLPDRRNERPPVNDFGVRLPPGTQRIDCTASGCRFVGALDARLPVPVGFLCPEHVARPS